MLILLAGLGAAPSVQGRTALGQFDRWGAFREPPGRCFAMAEPTGGRPSRDRPFVAITRARGGGAPRFYVATSRPPRPGTPLRLEIGERRFALMGSGGADAREDARIIAAMRRADRLRVLGVDMRGRRFRDDYPLAGAPSAIDAAIIGCLP
ncbi:hypothetical protein [Sphingomonas sp. MMS24-J13]|uniref:hypothetical protein n=1 Tax=Sphingomonas sp. MMS24-J13 TaxID=3238686 RepID=UPI00384DF4B3